MNFLKKLDAILSKIESFFLTTSILGMTFLLVGNVIARKIFNSSWTFAEEVGQLLVVVCTFMGIGYAVRRAEHVNMSAIIDNVSDKSKKMLTIVICIISMLTMFYFSYLGFKYMNIVYQSGRITPALEIPRFIITIFMPLGFLSGGIRYLISLILNLKNKDQIYSGVYIDDGKTETEITENFKGV